MAHMWRVITMSAYAAHTQQRERERERESLSASSHWPLSLIAHFTHSVAPCSDASKGLTFIHLPAHPTTRSLACLLALTSQQHRRHDSCKTATGCTPQQPHVSNALSGDSPARRTLRTAADGRTASGHKRPHGCSHCLATRDLHTDSVAHFNISNQDWQGSSNVVVSDG
jgi:hypothetical protein